MKSLYSKINRVLLSTFEQPPQGHALKRIQTLSGLIAGMIKKGDSHMPAIGSGLCKDIDANSKTIAATRFIDSKWVDYETHYLPFLTSFLMGMIQTYFSKLGEIILAIDGSQMGKDNAALMVSIVWRRRAIPICWFVKQGSKGHFTEQNHVRLLEQTLSLLLPLVPKGIRLTLLGDGEFDGTNLQECCLENGVNYALRTACNSVFYKEGERFQSKQISPENGHDCVFINKLEFTEKRFCYVNFVCWHNTKKYLDPIFLVSNLDEPGDIIEYYDLRYSIECLFKDIKSSSFNIHKTRLKKPHRVFNLLLVACLAFLLLAALAFRYDQKEYRKKVHRVRADQKVCSFFTFALLLLEHFLENETPFKFNFQFSKIE